MPSTCEFEFDRLDPVYFSGEVVNGRIRLTTTSDKPVREVYILFTGEAKVHWTESRTRQANGKTQHYTEHYRGRESYINSKTEVYPEGTLPPGTHTYTFSIPLPLQCPSSCVEKHGKISYELSLVLNRVFRFDNVFKQTLTVLRQVNLNHSPEYLIPIVSEDIKYLCCWPCSSGPVISTVIIQFGGYAPGQKIKYNVCIDNQSPGYDLDGIELELMQIYNFIARTPHHKVREHKNVLAKTAQPERCLRFSKKMLDGELAIPPVPPTTQDDCIIEVSYYIKIVIKTGDCHNDAEITVPIVIGTVPLVQSATHSNNVPVQPIAPSAPNVPDTPSSLDRPPSYDALNLPSFEEATTIGEHFVDVDVDEHHRNDDFIPKYPMYTHFAVPSAPPFNCAGATSTSMSNNQSLPPPYPADAFDNLRINQPSTTSTVNYGWST